MAHAENDRTAGCRRAGRLTDPSAAMRRYLDLVAPSHPPIEVATGHADAVGEAQRSNEVQEARYQDGGAHGQTLLG